MINKILRLFANTLTFDDKNYMLNRDNLTQPIQMELDQKQKIFLNFFLPFLKFIFNFKRFPIKDDPHN